MDKKELKKSYKLYRKKLKYYALGVVCVGVLLTLVSLITYSNANKNWKLYLTDSSIVYSKHDHLVQLIGYGGFIHDFKNLVIRKDVERYEPRLVKHIEEILDVLDELSILADYEEEAIKDIRLTILDYSKKIKRVTSLIRSGATTEEIDNQVKVDDTKALAALSKFDRDIQERLREESIALTDSFNVALSVHFVSVAGFIAVLLFYFRRLTWASKQEQKLADKALAASQVKSDFLANMSHEVRTPLNGIMGMLQLLQQNLVKSENKEQVEKALFSARSLRIILNDILDFSKIEANQLSIESIDFSLLQVVESVASDMLPLAQNKSIYLNLDIDKEAHKHWMGDPVRIRQILLNLVSNAVKFTNKGGVTIKVTEQIQDNKPCIHFLLSDTGIGMKKEAVAKVFERFSQADNSVTRRFGGTGLGMAITHKLIELMSGSIRVKSKEGKGTEVLVNLPLTKSNTSAAKDASDIEVSIPNLKDKVILVAEDNLVNQTIVKMMLAKTNAKVHLVENGKQAIERYKEIEADLVLMDIQMPEVDGVQACRSIQKQNSNVPPIIALTANVMNEDIEKYQATGFAGYLGKPLEMHLFYQLLSDYLAED